MKEDVRDKKLLQKEAEVSESKTTIIKRNVRAFLISLLIHQASSDSAHPTSPSAEDYGSHRQGYL